MARRKSKGTKEAKQNRKRGEGKWAKKKKGTKKGKYAPPFR